jgi:hypothetical protein
MAWFAKEQAQLIVERAHERVGKAWSWMAKAMREAVIAREVSMFLAEQPVTDWLIKINEINDLFEASYELAGLRQSKSHKRGVRAQDRMLSARSRG